MLGACGQDRQHCDSSRVSKPEASLEQPQAYPDCPGAQGSNPKLEQKFLPRRA
jgi:hypothetical protein